MLSKAVIGVASILVVYLFFHGSIMSKSALSYAYIVKDKNKRRSQNETDNN